MKKKTFNAQRSTSNIQWIGFREDEPHYGQKQTDGVKRKFDLEDRLLEFAVRLTRLVDALPSSRTGNHVAGQLLRCGTSPFANHGEVHAAESRKDFIHKLGVCFKELKEVRRWLRFIARLELSPQNDFALCCSKLKNSFESSRRAFEPQRRMQNDSPSSIVKR
jgi:four helix bundle protein